MSTCMCALAGTNACTTCNKHHKEVGVASVTTNTGWMCPRCGAVNAPFITRCACSSGKGQTEIHLGDKELKKYFQKRMSALETIQDEDMPPNNG